MRKDLSWDLNYDVIGSSPIKGGTVRNGSDEITNLKGIDELV